MRIRAGITTVHGREQLRHQTIASLQEADFIIRNRVYFDTAKAGCWQSWIGLLRAMLRDAASEPQEFSHFLLCEDDVLFARGLHSYLHHNPPPPNSIANLFCNSECHSTDLMQWHEMPVPHRAQGSLALLVPLAIAKRILANPPFPDRRDGTDHNIGTFCSRSFFDSAGMVPFVTHSPSLVLHATTETSLVEAGGREELRQAFCFAESLNASPEISYGSNRRPVSWPLDGIGEFRDEQYSARRLSDGDPSRSRLPPHPHTLTIYYPAS